MNAELAGTSEADAKTNQQLVAFYNATKLAEAATETHGLAALTLARITGAPESAHLQKITEGTLALQSGSLEAVEGTLLSQAVALDGMFHTLAQSAHNRSLPLSAYETYLKLALRAQAQSARTLEIIANIKQGPKVFFAGQVNAAQQQVVNNGNPTPPAERIVRSAKNKPSRPRARVKPKPLQEPSTSTDAHALDRRSQRKAAPAHSKLAAVD